MLHLACDGPGRPLGFVVTGGQVSDLTGIEQVMAAIQYRVGNTSTSYQANVTVAALLQRKQTH